MNSKITTTEWQRIFKYGQERGRMFLYCFVGIETTKDGEPVVTSKRISAAINLNDREFKNRSKELDAKLLRIERQTRQVLRECFNNYEEAHKRVKQIVGE